MKTTNARSEGQEGIALIVTVLLLLMVSAIGISALQQAGDELTASSTSRRKVNVVYAADAALNVVINQVRTSAAAVGIPNTQPFTNPALMNDDAGFPIAAWTGTADNAVPQAIFKVGSTQGAKSQLNVNSANTYAYGVYRTGVAAADSAGGRAQVQAQFTVPEGAAGY